MELFNFIDLISSMGFTGLLIILAIPKLRKRIFGNGNGAELKEIKENHLHDIAQKLDRIIEQNQEVLIILRNIK